MRNLDNSYSCTHAHDTMTQQLNNDYVICQLLVTLSTAAKRHQPGTWGRLEALIVDNGFARLLLPLLLRDLELAKGGQRCKHGSANPTGVLPL